MGVEEQIQKRIKQAVIAARAAGQITFEGPVPSFSVDRPKHADHGDLATNLALVLAKKARSRPRDLAQLLVEHLQSAPEIDRIELAGPGFLNMWLTPRTYHEVMDDIQAAGAGYGRGPAGIGERILLEFVSANPTGPLLISHGRGAILGDAVGRLLEAAGHHVVREYYINDFGNQVRLLASSVRAADAGQPPPEGGYGADYVKELASWIRNNAPDLLDPDADLMDLARMCITRMLEGIPGSSTLPGIRRTLAALRIHFDSWYSEESLHRWGRVRSILQHLEQRGNIVEVEGGALAFRLEGGEDDKDRVVRKSDGKTYTYFASDIAYHADKVDRGFERIVDVLGADHHGYVARLRGALSTVGFPKDNFEVLLYQLVSLLRDGKPYKMGKRLGNLITVEEVVEEIDAAAGRAGAGADALRYYYLSRRTETPIELDIELAKKQSLDNPVFYLQYGHARLCAILRRAKEKFDLEPQIWSEQLGEQLTHPDELKILLTLGRFPHVVREAAEERAPHKLVFYLQELSKAYQSYYTRLKTERDPILPQTRDMTREGWESEWNWTKTRARLAWIEAIRTVYASGLSLLGITAPERMDRVEETNEEQTSSA